MCNKAVEKLIITKTSARAQIKHNVVQGNEPVQNAARPCYEVELCKEKSISDKS